MGLIEISGHDFRYPELADSSRVYGALARETQWSLDNDMERESISMVISDQRVMNLQSNFQYFCPVSHDNLVA